MWIHEHPISDIKTGLMAKLASKWIGPATVKRRLGPVNYHLALDSKANLTETHHVENIKMFSVLLLRTSVVLLGGRTFFC